MFKFIGIVTLVVFLFNGCSAKAPTPTWKYISVNDNQLKNPSFELIDGNKTPSFWNSKWTRTWSNGAHNGKQFLRHPWASGETTTKQVFSLKQRGFNLIDVDKSLYKIKFGGFQKGTNNDNEKGDISVAFFDVNYKFILNESIGKINAGTQWKKREKTVQVPKKTRHIQYNFTVYKPKSTQRSKGPYLDDTFLYVFKAKQEIKQTVIIPKVETKKTSISGNEDISTVAYVQDGKVFYKNLKTDEIIFQREYKCGKEIGTQNPLVSIQNNILLIISCRGYKDGISFGDTELIHPNKNIKDVKVKYKAGPITSDFYGLSKDGRYEIYDFINQKLLYSFATHSKVTLRHFIDKKSNKIVFYETNMNPSYSSHKGNDFSIKNIYIFDMKSKKGKKISLAKKGKKYKSIFPVGFFVGTKKNGDKVFYQISAQTKRLDRAAIAAENGFKDKEWDDLNIYQSALYGFGSKAAEIFYKGINLSTMKFEKLNTNYIFSNLELNRMIDLKDVFSYLDELGGPTRTKNIEYKKLSYANSQRVNDKLAIQYVGDFNNGLSLVDLKTGNIVYASKRNIYHLSLGMSNNDGSSSNLYREGKDRGPYNIVSLDINTKQKNFKIKKKLYSFQANRDLTYRFFESTDDKLLLVYKSERIGRTRDFSKTLSVINIATGKVFPIALPNNLKNTGFNIMKFTNEKIFITTDKTYEVINLNNKGGK